MPDHAQASMPVVVFLVGVMFGTETFTFTTGLNMIVVGTGIAIASYGEDLLMQLEQKRPPSPSYISAVLS